MKDNTLSLNLGGSSSSTAQGFVGCDPSYGNPTGRSGCWHLSSTDCVCACHAQRQRAYRERK